jgi:hypothetical protein
MGLDTRHQLGAGVGQLALQQRLHGLGSDRAANVGDGSVILYVRWYKPLSQRLRSSRFNHQQYSYYQSNPGG